MSFYLRVLASPEELESDLAVYFVCCRRPNSTSIYRNTFNILPEDALGKLEDIYKHMNDKIAAKNSFLAATVGRKEPSTYDNYAATVGAGVARHSVIQPCDFLSLQATPEFCELLFADSPRPIFSYATLSAAQKLQFLACVSSLDCEGDTALRYESIFSSWP